MSPLIPRLHPLLQPCEMLLVCHCIALLHPLPCEQAIGFSLAAGIEANLSKLSLGLMGLRGLPWDLGLMHLFPALGADGQCPQHTAAAFA
jgi:hypothetical protein